MTDIEAKGPHRTGAKLPVDEAALMLGVSPYTLRAWIRQRRLPFFRLGRRIVFDSRDLEAFLRANRVEPREGDYTKPHRRPHGEG